MLTPVVFGYIEGLLSLTVAVVVHAVTHLPGVTIDGGVRVLTVERHLGDITTRRGTPDNGGVGVTIAVAIIIGVEGGISGLSTTASQLSSLSLQRSTAPRYTSAPPSVQSVWSRT
jgi:hypothetical protein